MVKYQTISRFLLLKGSLIGYRSIPMWTARINTFFDGCLDAVVREGIPGVELKEVINKQDPFDLGGVGGLATQTKDVLMVVVPHIDDKLQVVRYCSMTKETS